MSCIDQSSEVASGRHEDVVDDRFGGTDLAIAVMPREVEEIQDLHDGVDMVRELSLDPGQLLLPSCLPTDRHVWTVGAPSPRQIRASVPALTAA